MQPHEFWQQILPASHAFPPPYDTRFPARLPDGRVLMLPIRALGDSGNGIASLILNQSAFAVEATLADILADRLRAAEPEVVVGLPTLGLSLARLVAERLGHARFVALGTSRKFWYDEALSVPLRSITSPDSTKRLYLDPRMLPLLQGRRIALVDDVISSGTSICAGLALLATADLAPIALGTAMLQTRRWEDPVRASSGLTQGRIVGVLETPLLSGRTDGWWPA